MGKFELYKLPLKSLPFGTQDYSYYLDDLFFKNIDGDDFQRGKVNVSLVLKRTTDVFELNFEIEGIIQIQCDRCLDNMDFPVSTKERIFVKFGKEYSEENDDVVIIPETEGEINIAWFLYEFIALTIPLKHVHPTGQCNKPMSSKLRKHAAHNPEEEEDGGGFEDEDAEPSDQEERENDPRWDELKKIIDNN